jgi:hypothetical protein
VQQMLTLNEVNVCDHSKRDASSLGLPLRRPLGETLNMR